MGGMKKSTIHGIILIVISLCVTFLGLEIALRIYHGMLVESPQKIGRMKYHARLGWMPRPGQFGISVISNVDESGLRSNGRTIPDTQKPILAVGDSFTFGDEVEDSETWPAQLEGILNQPVLNAGVGAYGIDQAVLRAELLIDRYHPRVVILPFIYDDIKRTQYSYYPWGRGPKPYFALANGSLVLRNVPVPEQGRDHGRNFRSLRGALGYSFLAGFVMRRIAPRWWHNLPKMEAIRAHDDGEEVSVALLTRLDGLTRHRGGQFIAIALATNGRIGDNVGLPQFVERARKKGIQVLDLAMETLKLSPDEFEKRFRPHGHYSPAMNEWVADRIATFLYESGMVKRPNG